MTGRGFKAIKDKAYWYFAQKNWGVRREYGPYKEAHREEHIKYPYKDWVRLLHLNFHYRVLRRKDYLYERVVPDALPYLKGSESSLTKRIAPIFFVKELLKYDIISFDIFDTLIFRPFTDPRDSFMLMGQKLGYYRLASLRVEAEKKARDKKEKETGSREVTIEEIHDYLSSLTGLNSEETIELEYQMEKNICYPNPYMKQVYDLLMANGKKIILISDMYLRKKHIQGILEKCGYLGYKDLFISCEYGVDKKTTGDLFMIAKRQCGAKLSYCHIGDNEEGDVVAAEKNGFHAYSYQNINSIGNKYRATYGGMSALIGSAYGGIVNASFHNGLKKHSLLYEYGYAYGGIYILGYCNWIYKKAKQYGLDKILFLARDGDIYMKVFQRYFPKVSCEYVYWSRLPNIRIMSLYDRHVYIDRYLERRRHDLNPMSLEALLEVMRLEVLTEKLSDYGLNKDELYSEEKFESLKQVLLDSWDTVLSINQREMDAARRYFEELIEHHEKIGVVDIGWAGSGPLSIKHLVENVWKMNCEVHCFFAASFSVPPSARLPQVVDETIETYIFNETYNRDLKEYHVHQNSGLNNMFFELLSQAQSPTLEGFSLDEQGEPVFHFGYPEVEDYAATKEIQNGICDFIDDYMKRFKEYPYMLNISGHDAYIPFRQLTKKLDLLKRITKDMTFVIQMGNNKQTMKSESIKDILKKKGL